MRRTEDTPIDPSVAAALDAIDATLAGDPVDPQYAELAELALLLTVIKPEMDAAFASDLDARVECRFDPARASTPGVPRRRRRLQWWPTAGAGAVGLASVIGLVVALAAVSPGGSSSSTASFASASSTSSASSSTSASAPAPGRVSGAGGASNTGAAYAPSVVRAPHALKPFVPPQAGSIAGPSAAVPAPPNNGRKTIQSAQVTLTTPGNRVDDVAQQVFNVVGAENGFVNGSEITQTGGPDGYAHFQLSVPSANLADTMMRLSELRGARVASRTDNTQDVTDQFNGTANRLAQDQALRTSLLKQLANASTQDQMNALQQQLNDANGAIATDQRAVNSLNHQINYSQIQVSINAGIPPTPVAPHHSGGFGLGQAAHDAGRVLTIGAGVALIALAGLVPVGLIAALLIWAALLLRRRRREHALDVA